MFGKGIFCAYIAFCVVIVGPVSGLDYDNDPDDNLMSNTALYEDVMMPRFYSPRLFAQQPFWEEPALHEMVRRSNIEDHKPKVRGALRFYKPRDRRTQATRFQY